MIHVYSAGAPGALVGRLAEVLADAHPDPFTPEWLAVPSDGMRRWLTLELARRLGASGPDAGDGIAANVVRAYPGDLRSAVLAVDRPDGEADPWRIERMVWPILEALVEADGGTDLPVGLAALEGQREGASLYAKGRRVADLFDRYHLHRPRMVQEWARGRTVDGTGRALDDHTVWQARLWGRIRERIGEPSPPERLPAVLRRLEAGEPLLDLPPRLVLFGFTLLPAGAFLDVARAVAVSREVHVFMLEPTHLDPQQLLLAHPRPEDGTVRPRSNEAVAGMVEHPLLRSWGRLHRETALQLADVESEGVPVLRLGGPAPIGVGPGTLLGRLQHDLRANRTPEATLDDDPGDDSVQFHSCFGPTRQVEVLRDTLLHLLARPESTLTEDDIVVLCPALDRFAPLIEAAFGRTAAATTATTADAPPWSAASPGGVRHGPPALRYRVADRSIRTTNPVLSAASALLELVAGPFDVDSVLEFLALGPVRERFGFDDDNLGVIGEWVQSTSVRWGLDPSQRQRLGLPDSVVTNTWAAALGRLMIGSSVFDEDLRLAIGDIAPYGVEGDDVETLGSLAAVISCLADLALDASVARPLDDWVERIGRTCAALFSAERDQGWQLEALERILGEVVESARLGGAVSSVALEFGDVWKLLDERLDDKVGRADFFRGGITITSLTPLRWVPFRVVCLLGMDQSAFGAEGSAGDDLSALAPLLGDRDPRGEARETLLEAVLAARDHLVVVRDGHDVRTNQAVPMAVPTTELYESLLASVAPGQRAEVARRLEIDHPRQPYDERCFEPGRLIPGSPWGFDGNELAGALARRDQAVRRAPFLAEPLDPVTTEVIELSTLHRFLRNPTAAFFSARLEARLPRPEEDTPTALAVDIAGLDGWAVGSRLLVARQSGHTFEEWLEYERQLGTLPPPPLGDGQLRALDQTVQSMLDTAHLAGMAQGPARPWPVDALLPDGTRIVGSVPLRLGGGDGGVSGPAELYYSRFKPTHRVAAWLDLMALVATDPTRAWRSLAVSRPDRPGADPTVNDLGPSLAVDQGQPSASEVLAVAVDCYRRGMREPLPLFPTFSWYLYHGKNPRSRWKGYPFPEDGDQLAVRLAFGDVDFDTINALAPEPDDPERGRSRAMRFATYLHRTVDQSTTTRAAAGTDTRTGTDTIPAESQGR
jgi:exodeoxyribonuclease V gamma subunit